MTPLEIFLKEKFGIEDNKKMEFFEAAFTHSSYKGDDPDAVDYERLELLGDAFITLIVIEKLYHDGYSLKDICLQKKGLVSRVSFAWVAKDLGLDKVVRIGKGCKTVTASMIGDVFESFIGAVYQAVGFDKAKEIVVDTVYRNYVERRLVLGIDYKTKLQEWAQSQTQNGDKLVYKTVGGGPKRVFKSTVYFKNEELGSGTGTRHKSAEQEAARAALINLKLIEKD